MDDLDALLADLQSTTSRPGQVFPPPYDPSYRPHHESSGYHSDSRSSTPPPLPPPPAEHILNQVQQIYEPQVIQPPSTNQSSHSYYSHQSYTSSSITNNAETPQYNSNSSEFTQHITETPQYYNTQDITDPDPHSQHHIPSPAINRQVTEKTKHTTENNRQVTENTRYTVENSRGNKPMSSLTNNLSELDVLLQDLNSAQFLADVDKRSSTAPAGVGSDGTSGVDRLLNELESSVPNPPQSRNSYEYPPVGMQPQYTIPQKPAAASSATQELDDIMASLSNFKMDSVTATEHPSTLTLASDSVDASYAKPHKGKGYETPTSPQAPQVDPPPVATVTVAPPVLAPAAPVPIPVSHQEKRESRDSPLDSMLGTLQSDLNRQGITTTSKGYCAACNKPVAGKVITAVGRVWHTEHFVCFKCERELGNQTFYERDNKVYCENDYHLLFAPRCAYCKGPILDQCVTALGASWHTEHFLCAHCGVPFYDEGFHEKDGQAFCKKDYFEKFAPKCGGCGYAIMDQFISALNQQWHTECFVCRECRVSFEGGSFFDHDGLPYCEMHYYEIRGSLCYSCHKPITGRCITAMGRKFHPEHFVCVFCRKQLNKGTFKDQNDKPYCHPCFVKLFG